MGLISLADSLPKGFGLFSLKDKNSWMATLYDGYINALYGIAADSNGIIYTVGYVEDATYPQNLFAVKYDNTGVVQWQKKETTAQGIGFACSINGTTEIYISSRYVVSGSQFDLVTVKLNDSGTLQWQRRLGTSGDQVNYTNFICNDASGNPINVSSITNSTVYEAKGLIAKYNSSGTLQWQRNIANGIDTYYSSVASDSSSNVYAAGYFTPNAGYTNYKGLLVKYDSSGTLQWQRELGDSAADGGVNSVAVDSSGNVYIGCYSNHSRSYYSYRLAKYNSSGTLQWQRELYSSTIDIVVYAIAMDSSDNIYSVNYCQGSPSTIGIVKYDSSGTIQWQRQLSTSIGIRGVSIKIVGLNIYISAVIFLSGGDVDTLVIKVPTDGSKTGTYTLNGYTYTYAASTFSETASSLTSATSTLTGATTTHTDQSLSMTLSTTTLTDAIVRF